MRSVCEDAAHANAIYGPVVTAALVARLADLRAASHPLELPFVHLRPGTDDAPENVAVDLADSRSLIVAANPVAIPRTPGGLVAWEHVNRVIILRLE